MAREGPKRAPRELQEGPQEGSEREAGPNLAQRPLQDPPGTLPGHPWDPPGTPPGTVLGKGREGASFSTTTSAFFRCRFEPKSTIDNEPPVTRRQVGGF